MDSASSASASILGCEMVRSPRSQRASVFHDTPSASASLRWLRPRARRRARRLSGVIGTALGADLFNDRVQRGTELLALGILLGNVRVKPDAANPRLSNLGLVTWHPRRLLGLDLG